MVDPGIGGGNDGDNHAGMADHPLYCVPPPSEVPIFFEDDTDPLTWLAALKAQGRSDQLLRERIPGRLAETAFEWYGHNPFTNWAAFQRKFLDTFDHIAPGQCLRLVKEYTQQPWETLARYVERFTYLAEPSGVDEKMVRTDFVRGLSDSRLRKKIRKKCNPIEHTLTELIQFAIKYGKENYDVGLDSEFDEDDPSGVRRNSYSATTRMFEDGFGLGPAKKGSDRKASSSAPTSRRSGQAQGGRAEEEASMKGVAAQLVTVVAPLTELVQSLQRQHIAAAQWQQAAMAAGAPMTRPVVVGAVPPLRCYNCNQPGHLAKDCPKPRTQSGPAGPIGPSQIPLAAPTAAGQGRVATVMDTGAMEMVTPAATEIGPNEYMAAAMFEQGTIGVIRHVQRITEESELGPWRPRFEDLAAPSPGCKDGHIDVFDALKALDLRIPIPIPYLLTISEAANEKLIERYLKNRCRFEESRKGKKPVLRDLPTNEESQPFTSKVHETDRIGMIQTVDSASEKPEEHELLKHFQPPISDALLRNRFNDDRQLRFDIQQVNMSAPSVADLAVYSLIAQRVTYAGVYVDISPVHGEESTRVFTEFRAIQVATNFVHNIATFTGDLTVLPGHDREPAYRFLCDYALQLPYPMRNFPDYLVELTDVEQLPPADEDVWELHRPLYSSVVLGMFTFFVEQEVHNVGELLYVYYVIAKLKPEQKEGTVAFYPFGRIGMNCPGLLQLIHIELLSIAQGIAAKEEDLQLRLRTASAPCRSYNAAVIPDYLAREGESVVDFGHEDKLRRPPSSYPKSAALKAPRKRTVLKRRRSPLPEAQASRVGGRSSSLRRCAKSIRFAREEPHSSSGPDWGRTAPPKNRGDPQAIGSRYLSDPSSPISIAMQPGHQAQGGDWDEFHIPHPDPPSLQDCSDFASPPGIPRSLTLAVPPSRTVHQTDVNHMVELATIRLEAIEGAPRPDPAWGAFLQRPFDGCIAERLVGTLIYETGGRPNIMYHILVFAAVKRERRPYTETHLVLTGPINRPLRRRIIRAIADLAPRVLSHVPGAFLYPSFVQHHFNEVEVPANLATLASFLPPFPPSLNPEIDYFL
ncbi:hypothetical protein CBR_g46328 [Chara braunii]|uniref:CCHC-type domain-containing protein n=1 Tax=Chara braunii TaxID=69332 RepID=A0A388M0A3_CHABU|nr:hypothetical protein CBR_g46328 [Chara braunii]|eukprot:GBG87961.1 hypothetical protein CBR_g46328 [Chara braunii]